MQTASRKHIDADLCLWWEVVKSQGPRFWSQAWISLYLCEFSLAFLVFFPAPKNMLVDELAKIKCEWVCECVRCHVMDVGVFPPHLISFSRNPSQPWIDKVQHKAALQQLKVFRMWCALASRWRQKQHFYQFTGLTGVLNIEYMHSRKWQRCSSWGQNVGLFHRRISPWQPWHHMVAKSDLKV